MELRQVIVKPAANFPLELVEFQLLSREITLRLDRFLSERLQYLYWLWEAFFSEEGENWICF